MNIQFRVDSEILSPWVQRGQEVIWRENNPNYDLGTILKRLNYDKVRSKRDDEIFTLG